MSAQGNGTGHGVHLDGGRGQQVTGPAAAEHGGEWPSGAMGEITLVYAAIGTEVWNRPRWAALRSQPSRRPREGRPMVKELGPLRGLVETGRGISAGEVR